jgi:hypothetical protein
MYASLKLKMPSDLVVRLVLPLQKFFTRLAVHVQGYRVLYSLAERCGEIKIADQMIDALVLECPLLCTHVQGNFVWQAVALSKSEDVKNKMFSSLSPYIVELAQHKFGSNVIEKLIEFGSPEQREIIIRIFLVDNATLR